MKIKMLVMDIDGTLTDGKIYISATGEVMKAFNVKDGYRIIKLSENGIIPVIITGRTSEIVAERARELHISELYQGVGDKLTVLKGVADKYGILSSEVAYIGDDLNDLDCIRYCGMTACPSDAVEQLFSEVDYVCIHRGGDGAVREFIDLIYKSAQG